MLEIASPIIARIIDFQQNNENITHEFKNTIMRLFENMSSQMKSQGFEAEVTNDVQYALAALIDEVVMTSSWEFRNEWMAEPLQLTLFGEHLAGEDFFNKLEKLHADSSRNIELVELYYLCLQLGFKGRYHNEQDSQLNNITNNTLQCIQQIRGHTSPKLCNSHPINTNRKKTLVLLRPRNVFPLMGILILILYCTYWINITITANDTSKELEQFTIAAPSLRMPE